MNKEEWKTLSEAEKAKYKKEAEARDTDRLGRLREITQKVKEQFEIQRADLYKRKGIPECVGRMPSKPSFTISKSGLNDVRELSPYYQDFVQSEEEAEAALEDVKKSGEKDIWESIQEEKRFLQCIRCDKEIFNRCAVLSGMFTKEG